MGFVIFFVAVGIIGIIGGLMPLLDAIFCPYGSKRKQALIKAAENELDAAREASLRNPRDRAAQIAVNEAASKVFVLTDGGW